MALDAKTLQEMKALVEGKSPDWEVIAVFHDKKSGKVKNITVYDWLVPTDERRARKLAWAHDTRKDRSLRVRQVGDKGIGVPHDWVKHAPPEFHASVSGKKK